MRPELQKEVERMQEILLDLGVTIPIGEGVKDPIVFKEIERLTGIEFDQDLKDFYQFLNGFSGDTCAAVISDSLVGLYLLSLEEGMEKWGWFHPYDESHYEEWSVYKEEAHLVDKRVKPYLHHKLWFPIADANSTYVYYDADPTFYGKKGQIIVYQHDPDCIYFVADSFLDFLKKSNDLLVENKGELFY